MLILIDFHTIDFYALSIQISGLYNNWVNTGSTLTYYDVYIIISFIQCWMCEIV